jgi:hypothetical protein
MKMWIAFAVALCAAPAAPAERPARAVPALFERILERTAGPAREAVVAARDAALRYHELLRSLRGSRVTGLVDVFLKASEGRLRALLESALRTAPDPDLGRAVRGVLVSARERAQATVRTVLARLSPPPALAKVFALLGDAQGLVLGAPPPAAPAWKALRTALGGAMAEVRSWAVGAGQDAVREAMFEAILILEENGEYPDRSPRM